MKILHCTTSVNKTPCKFRAFMLVPLAAITLSSCVSDGQGTASQGSILNGDLATVIFDTLGSGNNTAGLNALTTAEIIAGLRQALQISTTTVTKQLGAANGFNLDPKIHIPLPENLQKVDAALSAIGMSALTDDLELRLNRAAEAATPRAKELFINSISQMTFADARNILQGPDDAATQFFRRTMGAELAQDMHPIVENTLAQAGAIQAYDRVMGQYQNLPFMPDLKADLNNFVVEKALDGIFYYVAQEEAAIRENPAKRTTELLRKVFGAAQ